MPQNTSKISKSIDSKKSFQQAPNRQAIPINRCENRRGREGSNSVNNFASSVKRSVDYLSGSLGSVGSKNSSRASSSSLIPAGTNNNNKSHIHSDSFMENERTPLLSSRSTIVDPINEESVSSVGTDQSNRSVLDYVGDVQTAEESCFSEEASALSRVMSVGTYMRRSTQMQTIFNSINVLIGLGILSVPLGFHLAGWIPGMICLLLAALSTGYTAILLGRILARVPQVKTYQDIAVYVYGRSIGYFILATFSLDLYGAGVSMIILFSDSFNALLPNLSPYLLKTGLCTLLLFLNMMPLRFLSFLSLTGIICTTLTFLIIVVSGFLKQARPGSLLHPMVTNLFPTSFIRFCFSLGLFLAPWGGHATFPEIYSDQQRPNTFSSSMKTTFSFCYLINAMTGVAGFLMYGAGIDSEVTRNILLTKNYPVVLKTAIVALMGLLPLSKLPLVCRPLVTAADKIGINKYHKGKPYCSIPRKLLNRAVISIVYLASALLITSFGKVMSLLGSAICFTVCITLPVLFYLNVYKNEIGSTQRILLYAMVSISVLCTIIGSTSVIIM